MKEKLLIISGTFPATPSPGWKMSTCLVLLLERVGLEGHSAEVGGEEVAEKREDEADQPQ